MSKKAVAAAIAAAIAKAQAGVDYSPRTGATCPSCGAIRLRVVTTRPWDGEARVRFHKCLSKGCLLETLRISVKSIESLTCNN